MKNKLSHIGISLFVVGNTLYEVINVQGSVFMSAFFFIAMYGTFTIWTIVEYLKDNELFFLAMCVGFGARVVMEIYTAIKYWMDFEDYINNVNDYVKGILICTFTLGMIITGVHNGRNNNRID